MTLLAELSRLNSCYDREYLSQNEPVQWHIPYGPTGFKAPFGVCFHLSTRKLKEAQIDMHDMILSFYKRLDCELIEVGTKGHLDLRDDTIKVFVRVRCKSESDESDADLEFALELGEDLLYMDVQETISLPPGQNDMSDTDIATTVQGDHSEVEEEEETGGE